MIIDNKPKGQSRMDNPDPEIQATLETPRHKMKTSKATKQKT